MTPAAISMERLIADAGDLAGIVAANINAQAELEGREVRPQDALQGITPLLAAALQLAFLSVSDRKTAVEVYSQLLLSNVAAVREIEGL